MINRVQVSGLLDAVIVAVPAAGKVAVLLDEEAKLTTLGLLEVQVDVLVTSVPFNVAVNACAVLPTLKVILATVPTAVVGHGLIVIPVGTVAVAVPVTPPKLAVMVTEPPVPTAVTFPALVPEVIKATAHGFEVLQFADFVTSLVVLSEYAAKAVKGVVAPAAGEVVLGLTVMVVGWLTKNPVHAGVVTIVVRMNASATNKAIRDSILSKLHIMLSRPPQSLAEAACKIVAEGQPAGWVHCTNV